MTSTSFEWHVAYGVYNANKHSRAKLLIIDFELKLITVFSARHFKCVNSIQPKRKENCNQLA